MKKLRLRHDTKGINQNLVDESKEQQMVIGERWGLSKFRLLGQWLCIRMHSQCRVRAVLGLLHQLCHTKWPLSHHKINAFP